MPPRDLESTAATDIVDIADALGYQYADLTPGERMMAAHYLARTVATQLRAGRRIGFLARDNLAAEVWAPDTPEYPWHRFELYGSKFEVHLVREYMRDGELLRDYQNRSGSTITVPCGRAGRRRKPAEEDTARQAAARFSGEL